MDEKRRYDAVVVGARCAGAATAMLLARRDLRVLAIDRGRYGSDTLSTHALMRAGVLQLARWNVLPHVIAGGTPPVRTTSFFYGDREVVVPIKARDGVDALYAPRRTILDRLLVDAARAAGATVAFGVRLEDVIRKRGRVGGVVVADAGGAKVRIDTGLLIGADGLRSTVARLVGAPAYRLGRHATATLYAYWRGLGATGYRWCYRPGVAAGAIATTGGDTCVFAVVPAARFRREIRLDTAAGYDRILAECAPDLASAVARATRVGGLHGFPGEIGFFRRSWGPGWALVGDAGYFRDPLTAHGITDALRDADLLSRAVARGGERAYADYQAERDDLATMLFEASDEIASFEWDLETLEHTHQQMAREMAREVQMLAAAETPAERPAAAAGPVTDVRLSPVSQP
jgi:2-polyprenyl-6-methoxyphenol hydroxylase-like FAD-dependent oxidoreductase